MTDYKHKYHMLEGDVRELLIELSKVTITPSDGVRRIESRIRANMPPLLAQNFFANDGYVLCATDAALSRSVDSTIYIGR